MIIQPVICAIELRTVVEAIGSGGRSCIVGIICVRIVQAKRIEARVEGRTQVATSRTAQAAAGAVFRSILGHCCER